MDLNSLKARVSSLAQTGAAKAKDTAEIAKLKVANAAEEDSIRKAYQELGKLYFAQHGAEPEAPYAALCAKIVECRETIAYNDQRINDIKDAAGLSDDPDFTIPSDSDFTTPSNDDL